MPSERLQKILSRAGIASRRQAEFLILAGKVSINGKVIRELGTKADPKKDKITVSGKPLPVFKKQFHYYATYKPRGVMVTKRDDWGRQTVFKLLNLPPEVNSVGRLDKDSEGLLLLSDDGEFIQNYTHPAFQVPKIYHVQISRKLTGEEKKKLLGGILLEGKRVRAMRIQHRGEGGANLAKKKFSLPPPLVGGGEGEGEWIEIELREGIKREIRRMLETFGIRVLRLIRVQHGSVRLAGLQPGELREIHFNKSFRRAV